MRIRVGHEVGMREGQGWVWGLPSSAGQNGPGVRAGQGVWCRVHMNICGTASLTFTSARFTNRP